MEEYFVEERPSWEKLLDFLVFLAVFVVTVFLILELAAARGIVTAVNIDQLNSIYFWVNIPILIIFVIDLIRIYSESTGFLNFLRKGWLDILATIPLGMIFQLGARSELFKWARVIRLTRIGRVSKTTRMFKAASHVKKESEEYQKKHRL